MDKSEKLMRIETAKFIIAKDGYNTDMNKNIDQLINNIRIEFKRIEKMIKDNP